MKRITIIILETHEEGERQRRIREGEKTQPHIQPEMCHLSQVYQQQLQSELNSILLLLLVLVFFNIIIMLLPVLKKNVMRWGQKRWLWFFGARGASFNVFSGSLSLCAVTISSSSRRSSMIVIGNFPFNRKLVLAVPHSLPFLSCRLFVGT